MHLGQQNQGKILNCQTATVLGAAHTLETHGNLPLGTPVTEWARLSEVSYKNWNTGHEFRAVPALVVSIRQPPF